MQPCAPSLRRSQAIFPDQVVSEHPLETVLSLPKRRRARVIQYHLTDPQQETRRYVFSYRDARDDYRAFCDMPQAVI